MYNVTIKKLIHSCFASVATDDVYIHKKLELNFIPFVGLNFIDGDFESGELKAITYDIHSQSFKCYVEDDKTYYDVSRAFTFIASKEQMKKLVAEYIKDGWEI